MREYKSVFLKAVFNSLLPEFIDSDRIDNESVSPELIATIRRIADHYYGSDEILEKHLASANPQRARVLRAGQIDYRMINEMLMGTEFGSKDDLDFTNLTNVLGTFSVKRNEDGTYNVYDKYDFQSNDKYFKEFAPEIFETLKDYGVEDSTLAHLAGGAYLSSQLGSIQPIAEMIGGVMLPDSKSPEEGGAQYVNLHIPREDVVENTRPAPRPAWFEDENLEPVFPATPMDDERKGLLDGVLDALFPAAQAKAN